MTWKEEKKQLERASSMIPSTSPPPISSVTMLGLVFTLAKVEDSHDVRMGAEAAHGLSFAGYAGARNIVQTLGLDEGEGHFPV